MVVRVMLSPGARLRSTPHVIPTQGMIPQILCHQIIYLWHTRRVHIQVNPEWRRWGITIIFYYNRRYDRLASHIALLVWAER